VSLDVSQRLERHWEVVQMLCFKMTDFSYFPAMYGTELRGERCPRVDMLSIYSSLRERVQRFYVTLSLLIEVGCPFLSQHFPHRPNPSDTLLSSSYPTQPKRRALGVALSQRSIPQGEKSWSCSSTL
jgi:hypothetical protein